MADLYVACFDESGTHDASEAVVVAGFVSNETNWEHFSVEWLAALKNRPPLNYFHMSEFANRQGPYALWTDTERNDRLNLFLNIIHEYVFQSVGIIVLKKRFDSLLSERAKRLCGDAYGLASLSCFRKLGDTAKDLRVDGVLDYVMERGARGGNVLLKVFQEGSKDAEWFNNNRIYSLDFRDKRVWLPLQAADMLAYELYKEAGRRFGGKERPVRYPLKRLSRSPQQWHYIDDVELKRVNEWLTNDPGLNEIS